MPPARTTECAAPALRARRRNGSVSNKAAESPKSRRRTRWRSAPRAFPRRSSPLEEQPHSSGGLSIWRQIAQLHHPTGRGERLKAERRVHVVCIASREEPAAQILQFWRGLQRAHELRRNALSTLRRIDKHIRQ